jgi:sn-glycerol 3-phosphate transport system ATP-binding protein
MAEVRYESVTKEFPGGTVALAELALEIADGEFMILVGPSGCGKTTALRLVAGLEKPTGGRVWVGETDVTGLTPRERDIAMVFQNYALYPHMSVYKNLAFGLRQRRTAKDEVERRVRDMSTMLGLDDLLKRRPAQLSGGQRQRVAMGRALVREPKAFLLDEPLSNLDAKLRVQMRAELKRLHQRLSITTIYVTHDQVEAMTLGDRIAVMNHGKLQQCGAPQDLYDHPTNLFVAGFIGSPPMNLLRGYAEGGRVTAGDLVLEGMNAPDGDVAVGVRPETLAPAVDGQPSFEFSIEVVEPLGDEVLVHGTTAGGIVESGAEEEDIRLLAEGSRATVTARFDPTTRPTPGERVRLGVRPDRVHLFDLRTGSAIH